LIEGFAFAAKFSFRSPTADEPRRWLISCHARHPYIRLAQHISQEKEEINMIKRYNHALRTLLYSAAMCSFLGIIGFTFIGCKGETGPAGPSGNADVSMYTFSFTSSDLQPNGSDSSYYYVSFSDPTIASKISAGAAVLLYIYADSIWNPLPYTEPHAPALSINYFLKDQSLTIEIITSYGNALSELIAFLNSDTYQVRLIVIPANNFYPLGSITEKSSYDEVKALLSLPD
jgi:hypothetical protein